MEFSILKGKKQIDGKIDLLSNVLKIDYGKVKIKDWIKIDDSTTMSLDLISYSMYGTEDHVDILMKFNRISNPLAIQVGQVIAVPELDSFRKNSRVINLKPIQLQRKKSLDNQSTSKTNQGTPSSKASQSQQNFTKKANGVLIF